MRTVVSAALLVGALVACTNDSSDRIDWKKVNADAISDAEIAMRSWCDPGTWIKELVESTETTRDHVRRSASVVRSETLRSNRDADAQAHEQLVTIAEFVAAAHHLVDIATSGAFVDQEGASNTEYLPLEAQTLIFLELSPSEREQFGSLDEAVKQRALEEVLAKQAAKFEVGFRTLAATQEAVRSLTQAQADKRGMAVVDVEVVDTAAECVRSLVEKRLPAQ